MKTQEARTETMSFDKELGADGTLAGGSGMTRRSFVGGMGAMMAAAAAMAAGSKTAFADEAAAETEEESTEETEHDSFITGMEDTVEEEGTATTEESTSNVPTIESVTGWTGTPEDVLALGVSTMPLDDLNQYRQAYIDAQTDYTKEDGTVIPAVYVKVRALIHTYGFGCGDEVSDTCFDDIVAKFTEDDAEAYLEMPRGVEFTAYDMAAESGRDVEECSEICERLAEASYLRAYDTNRGRTYNQVCDVVGVLEYHLAEYVENNGEGIYDGPTSTSMVYDLALTGTPPMYYVPVDASVTNTGSIRPYDDLKQKALQSNYCAIAPCFCRYYFLAAAYGYDEIPSMEDFLSGEYEDYFSPLCDQRVETCLMFGDEAQYWVEHGIAREITPEQAADYIQRSVDDGFMLESSRSSTTEFVCSCHADSCGLVQAWLAMGDADTIASMPAFQQISNYKLEVDADLCTACGLCVDRCPLHCISINDEGWAEPDANCFRCGQCAYVCPQEARHLVERDESELAPLASDYMDYNNVAAAYRFETGLITFPDSSDETATEETATEEAAAEETETEETATEETATEETATEEAAE